MATFVTAPGLLLFHSRTDVTGGRHSSSTGPIVNEAFGQSSSPSLFSASSNHGLESITHQQQSPSQASRSGASLSTGQQPDMIPTNQLRTDSHHHQQPLNVFSLAAQHFAETVSMLHSRHLQSQERRKPLALLPSSKSSRNPQPRPSSSHTSTADSIPELPSSLAQLAFRDSVPHLLSRTNGLFR